MKPEQQQLAQDLYFNTDKTQQEIADILNVNRRTVYLWVKNGRWEEMKLAAKQAPGIILQDIYNHIEAINGKIRNRGSEDLSPTMQEVEMLRKLINMTMAIQKKNTGSYLEVFSELLIFIGRTDDALATRVREFTGKYIRGTFGEKSFYTENNIRVNEVVDNLKKEDLSAEAKEAQAKATEPVIVSEAEPTVIVPVPIISGSPVEPTVIVPAPIISESPSEGQQSFKSSNLPAGRQDSENPDSDNNATLWDKSVIFSPAREQVIISPEMQANTVSGTVPATGYAASKYHIANSAGNGIFPEIKPTQSANAPPQPSP